MHTMTELAELGYRVYTGDGREVFYQGQWMPAPAHFRASFEHFTRGLSTSLLEARQAKQRANPQVSHKLSPGQNVQP